ncbi:uncharacterized protein PHACADRAFT_262926 [Phanerochaete carnosa HHB-10118-sp]|uniref:Yeast cell wall synthesis Kre9/Knh1-like N-terminal domain-containing protein n=1 Tax=Phanerochaete carnosa (strain HHB-10118-sp) TaxID=650164 RepID=K5VWM5_PHACS|nr:uncharacterized protein PHACADRAFT_262926 [Phanerochaete carnosa HHB-10118-sp]EKM50994.1 hypothetical protein PHACADRAFT_262926 [Phanerochaete carnosa HHB-10118-sp]
MLEKISKSRAHGGLIGTHHRKRDGNACQTGGFYQSPAANQSVPASTPFNITWDSTCLSTTAIDIYLYEPGAANSRIHLWETVDFSTGSYETQLQSSWWNSTPSVNLQLAIVQSGTPPFMATLPAGPVFQGTYTGTSNATTTDDAPASAIQVVNNVPQPKQGLSKGKLAAAVIMPLLIIAAIVAGVYFKIKRQKGKEKRKRWSEMVDKRMSTISTDWKPVTVAGASAAIRASMAVGESGDNRQSSFSFGAIRPASIAALDGGQAGIGAKGLQSGGIDLTTPQSSELVPGPRTRPRANTATSERKSRISFAADTRPSGESRRSLHNTRTSRAFHVGHVPPLPTRPDTDEISPIQKEGPSSLTFEDINRRMSGFDVPRSSMDEVMPAITMMRNDDLVQQQSTINPNPPMSMPVPMIVLPEPALQSPVMSSMPMQPMSASVMSPDEMLRAYAEQRRALASPPPAGAPALPSPALSFNGSGMRVLYAPDNRQSLSPTEHSKYSEADVYTGTAQ